MVFKNAMLSLTFQQNLVQRQTLIQRLGLESRFLESCLVRSEEWLRVGNHQAALRLVRRFEDEDGYRSVLDFLLVLFVPELRSSTMAFYAGRGPRLIDETAWTSIDRLDRTFVFVLGDLYTLYRELQSAAWRSGKADVTRYELMAAWLDFQARPRFAALRILQNAERKVA